MSKTAENQIVEGKDKPIQSFLEKKIVYLRPIPRPDSMLTGVGGNPDHVAFFKYNGTVDSFKLPRDGRSGLYLNPFTSHEEMKKFSELMNEDLSTAKRKSPFWKNFEVKIRKDDGLMKTGIRFDLSDPYQNLQIRILKMYIDEVCPSPGEQGGRPTYKYVIVGEEYEVLNSVKKSDIKKAAYIAFGQIDHSRTIMTSLLRIRGNMENIETNAMVVDGSASREFLISEIDKWIEKNPQEFLDHIKDPNFELKAFIQEALSIGAMVRKNNRYELPGGDLIGRNLEEAMNYFKDPINQDIELAIKAKIKASPALK